MIYRLYPSTDIKIIGKSPQIESCVFTISYDDDSKSSKGFWYHEADLSKIIFPQPIIVSKANLTDYIPCSVMGTRDMPLVGKGLKELLEKSAYGKIQFIPAVVWYKNEQVKDYYFMNCYDPAFELVDFNITEVYWNTSQYHKLYNKKVEVSNLDQFFEVEKLLKKPPVGIKMKNIHFKSSYRVDFFFLRWIYGGHGYFVSDQIKKIIEAEKFSGMQFKGVNEDI